MGPIPVSYTHLDVYKRQTYYLIFEQTFRNEQEEKEFGINLKKKFKKRSKNNLLPYRWTTFGLIKKKKNLDNILQKFKTEVSTTYYPNIYGTICEKTKRKRI